MSKITRRHLVHFCAAVLIVAAAALAADQRPVEPTFLRRALPDGDVDQHPCRWRPLFGEGDAEARVARGVVRYAVVDINELNEPCRTPVKPNEEQVAVVLEGTGRLDYAGQRLDLKAHDFVYLPPGVERRFSGKIRLILMGFRLPEGVESLTPEKPLMANWDDVALQQVGGHPPTTLYRLMMGDVNSKRDRIAAGRVLTSLYIMEFAPGGTNAPHHHDTEEEIYLVLSGKGEMVAGGGVDGTENRVPAKPGDAFFFRLNCTVGFYSSTDPGNRTVILAVRSLYPRRNR
jgi:mannose-6-phosphate isomerase-like protein (cupin superfamily)